MTRPEKALWVMVVITLLALAMVFVLATNALAHSWYSGQRNSVTGISCCGGSDCWEFNYEQTAWISETETEYVVTIPANASVAQFGMSGIQPGRVYSIAKELAQPTPLIENDGKEHSGFHACVWGGKLRCFFYPSFS